jgi:receptor expression-enhancing protein 5/6
MSNFLPVLIAACLVLGSDSIELLCSLAKRQGSPVPTLSNNHHPFYHESNYHGGVHKKALALRGGSDTLTGSTFGTKELTPAIGLSYMAAALLAGFTVSLVRKVPRSGGHAPRFVQKIQNIVPSASPKAITGIFHAGYFAHAMLVLWIMPKPLTDIVFSPQGVTLLGTAFPIVESIRAQVSDTTSDDIVWLQYWIMHGLFSYSTEFVDNIAEKFPFLGKHWYAFEFYMILWLILPFTDGAAITYELFTKPIIVPRVQPIVKVCEGWLTTLALTIVNAGHLWFVAIIFMTLPIVLKRFAVIVVGTAFPILGTIVAVSTYDNDGEDTQWLTYWACFSMLYLGMTTVEKFVGNLPGLYTLSLAVTLYLMLPIFNGSEAVFRKILVPLFRLREALLIKDARTLARTMINELPENRHEDVKQAAGMAFLEEFGKKQNGKPEYFL